MCLNLHNHIICLKLFPHIFTSHSTLNIVPRACHKNPISDVSVLLLSSSLNTQVFVSYHKASSDVIWCILILRSLLVFFPKYLFMFSFNLLYFWRFSSDLALSIHDEILQPRYLNAQTYSISISEFIIIFTLLKCFSCIAITLVFSI